MIVCSALILWKTLSLYTNSESPIVVVLSGSMEPAFYRGDILFLSMPNEPVKVGDIVVFKIPGREVPIVHRVIKLHDEVQSGKQYILTKGDNNQVDDRGLYNKNQVWIHKEHLVGKVNGFLPYVGIITIAMNDYPQLKYFLIIALAIYVLINRE
ncbi:22633_t:CDS:2 [Entrophospora sp. SA101]|nr:22633_t:CDS:2 [Entrophospora sp. SA101]CAJ0879185.1 8859_t:CDS:2 [Entrophospora sp. SA101]